MSAHNPAYQEPGPARCLYWDGSSYQLACPDDLCHGSDHTLCGLEHGFDFDVWESDIS